MSPIFSFTCPNCNKEVDRLILKITKTRAPQFCDCGHQMDRVPEVPGRFIRGSGGWSSPASKG